MNRKVVRFLSNFFAFVGLWVVAVLLQDYVFHIEDTSFMMVYGYVAIRLCDWLADKIFPWKMVFKKEGK